MNANTEPWPEPDIPADHIIPFDLFAVEAVDGDLHAGFYEFASGCPDFFYSPLNGGHWVLNSAALAEEVIFDVENFSNRGVAGMRDAPPNQFRPGSMDPPEHRAYRLMAMSDFNRPALASIKETVRLLVCETIERVLQRGRCDFAADIAAPLPIKTFSAYALLPAEDTPLLLQHAQVITRDPDHKRVQASLTAIWDYLAGQLQERRCDPGDDFISHVATGELSDGSAITDSNRVDLLMNVTLGALDTTTASLGFAFNHLGRQPLLRQEIANNPGIVPAAVEEMLRRHGVLNVFRNVKRDMNFHGFQLRQNDLVLMAPALVNLDSRRYDNPLRANFSRTNIKHLTFSKGIHLCVGMHFARMLMRTVFEEWFRRIPDFRVAPGSEVKVASGRVNTVRHLELIW